MRIGRIERIFANFKFDELLWIVISITALLNIPQSLETFAEHFRGTLCGAGWFVIQK